MPSITLADEDDEESGSVVPAPMTRPTVPAAPAPQNRKGPNEAPPQRLSWRCALCTEKIGD